MKVARLAAFCLTALQSTTYAAALPQELAELERRDTTPTSTKVADSQCTNGPYSRACWKSGYSIATDFDQKFPTTGKTVYYNLVITNSTCNPDGYGSRICLLINNTLPGPVLRASWGDYLSITVTNLMQDNGTSIHWHGVRQWHSPGSDGVNGITECPLAPGDTKTYRFQVTQFGTTWYHAHFSSQYGDGVIGTMIFDGPASANYDEDLGVYPVNEWYYQTAYQINAITGQNLQDQAPPPPGNNILINGTNKDANGNGAYSQVKLTNGKKYRLRLVNVASDNFIRVSLDNHPMQIITSDFVPIKPIWANWVLLGVGQRYDVVITANQSSGNFWFRANVADDCLSGNTGSGRALWSYAGTDTATPTTTAFAAPQGRCAQPSPLAPYWYQPVPSSTFANRELDVSITKQVIVPNGDAIFVWALNTSSMNVQWEKPTLTYLQNGDTNYPAPLSVIPATSAGAWNYWLIQSIQGLPPVPHPIHLHGHDFFVIGSGTQVYNASTANLNWVSPPRRDTQTLPGGGWLALAFNSNNPGSWLMHCHIAWHVSEGLAVQFVESPGQITYPDASEYEKTCDNWKSYAPNAYYKKDDSGL